MGNQYEQLDVYPKLLVRSLFSSFEKGGLTFLFCLNLSISVSLLLFSSGRVFAQNGKLDIDELVKNGTPAEVQAKIQAQIEKYKGTPFGLYLEAVMDPDAAKGIEKYQQVLRKFPTSREAGEALFKVGQYYFSRGLYISSRKHFLQLIETYPKSRRVGDSMYLAAACLYAAGKYRSCYVELNNFLRQNSTSEYRKLAEEDLKEIRRQIGDGKVDYAANRSDGKYAIQVGAFSDIVNAENMKNYCEKLGLPVERQQRKHGGKNMYLIWVGSFKSEDEARAFGDKFKREHGKPFRVVRR